MYSLTVSGVQAFTVLQSSMKILTFSNFIPALQEAEENGNATESSTPSSTPRFLHETKPVGGIVAASASTQARVTNNMGETSNTLQDVPTLTTEIAFRGVNNSSGTKASKSSSSGDGTARTISGLDSESVRDFSSLVAEQGSSKEADGLSSGRSDSKSNCSRGSQNEDIKRMTSTAQSENSHQQTTTTGNIPTDSVFQDNVENSFLVLPQSRKSTGLPSPKKFLSYMKDKHNMKKKHLKQKLKDARRREHLEPEAKEEEEVCNCCCSDILL